MAFIVSIAGSDSSGGAGIQADLSCIKAMGHHALSVITAITAQDVDGVQHVSHSDVSTINTQLSAGFSSFKVGAVKSGLIPNAASIQALAKTLKNQTVPLPYVLDPVICASSGEQLVQEDTMQLIVDHLFPLATVVTPNISEAEKLTGRNITTLEEIVAAGKEIMNLGCHAVLVTGGHSACNPAVDVFLDSRDEDSAPKYLRDTYVADRSPRGTGCTFASAIACGLATQMSLFDAIRQAKRFITAAIAGAELIESDLWLLNHYAGASEL